MPRYEFAALQPLLVQAIQLAFCAEPVPLTPLLVVELVFTWVQTWIVFAEFVGFQTAPVRSWYAVYATVPGVVVTVAPLGPEDGSCKAYGL